MPRYMAIDYGSKRIGLAVGDTETCIAAPILGVAAKGDFEVDARAVMSAATEYGADVLVLGLPLNMDDTEGPQAKLVRDFGEALGRHSRMLVQYWDERLSSEVAREKLSPAELTRKKKKKRLDGVAAQAILQEFLESLGGDPSGTPRSDRRA